MATVAAASCDAKGAEEPRAEKKPLKPCCACPETKKARDACKNDITWHLRVDQAHGLCFAQCWNLHLWGHIIEKGEENCGHLIEAHKECMRALGFKI